VAETLIRAFLPKIAEQIVDGSVEILSPVFVNKKLNERRADHLLKAMLKKKPGKSGKPGKQSKRELLLVLDHKSAPAKEALHQMATYGLQAHQRWQSLEENAGRLLPPIERIIVYNGGPKWNVALRYSELVDSEWDPTSTPMEFGYTVIALRDVPDEVLYELGELGIALLALKHAKRLHRNPKVLDKLFELLAAVDCCEFVDLTVCYLLLVCRPAYRRTILARAQMIVRKEEPMYMTIADAIKIEGMAEGIAEGIVLGKAEGRAEGMAEGLRKGKVDTLLGQLVGRFGAVSPAIARRVRKANEARLDAWLGRILFADTIDGVFRGVGSRRRASASRDAAGDSCIHA